MLHNLTKQRGMATMHTVERADGDNGAHNGGKIIETVVDIHGANRGD
jgi:hypothetical protein